MRYSMLKIWILVAFPVINLALEGGKEVCENGCAAKPANDLYFRRIRDFYRGPSFYEQLGREVDAYEWSYSGRNGPKSWVRFSSKCGSGRHQSPININTNYTTENKVLVPFVFYGYEKELEELYLSNNGHTVTLVSQTVTPPIIERGGFRHRYAFTQLHFHWGDADNRGSEHLVNGQRFPMEMHMIHQRIRESDDETPVTVILAVLFRQSFQDNRNLSPIVKSLKKVQFKDKDTRLEENLRLDSLLPDNLKYYFRYMGSHTVPPCAEGVQWTVFADTVPIGEKQLEEFRKLRADTRAGANTEFPNYLVNNFRNLQRLNRRQVYESPLEC